MKKFTLIASFVACLMILDASCTTNNGPITNTASSTGANLRLAFVTNNSSDFWTIARKGTEKADNEFNDVTVEFRMPADGTAAEQKRMIDDLVAKGIDGMAVSPVDPENQTQTLNDTAKHVLVVTQDSDAPKSDRAFYVGTDNVAAGRVASLVLVDGNPLTDIRNVRQIRFVVLRGQLFDRTALASLAK